MNDDTNSVTGNDFWDQNRDLINKTIDYLNLSERTTNALFNHWILFFKDFVKYSPDIRSYSKLKWLWKKAISELNDAFMRFEWYNDYSIENCRFYIVWKFGKQRAKEYAKNSAIIKETPYFEIDNKKYYIYGPSFIAFEDMRTKNFLINNNLSFYDILTRKDLCALGGAWRTLLKNIDRFNKYILRFYGVGDIYSLKIPYEEKLDFLLMFSWFYSWISDFEKKIIWLRLNWFNGWWRKITLGEIWQNSNLSRERIRQLQSRNMKFYEIYLSLIADQVEKSLIEKIPLISDYYHLYYWEIDYSSTFSISFLQISFYKIFIKEYWFYWSTDFFFFFKLYEGISLQEIQSLLKKIDKFYYTKKIKDQILTYDIILKDIKSDHNLIKPIIKYYLLNKFWIDEENWNFVFSFNTRDYDFLVMWELEKLDDPIHFLDLYKILCNEYHQFKFKEQTVHSVLVANDEAINVWKGVYIHVKKRPFLKWLKTTEDVIVKYLNEKENKRAVISEIIYFVKQYKDVDSWSIRAVLDLNKYWNFVKINNKEYWLKEYWL